MGAGVVVLVAGLALGGYAALDLSRRVAAVEPAQAALDRALEERWAGGVREERRAAAGLRRRAGPVEHRPGAPIARLYVPSIGLRLVVVEGVADAELALGPGRIPGTARFGEPGNVGLAAHRQPGLFWDLDRLRVDDAVIVETVDAWHLYRVDGADVVDPADPSALAGSAGAERLTLVTCEPKLTTARRLIRRASLVRRVPRTGAELNRSATI